MSARHHGVVRTGCEWLGVVSLALTASAADMSSVKGAFAPNMNLAFRLGQGFHEKRFFRG